MDKTSVVVSGLPGQMATLLAKAIEKSPEFDLLPWALTGEDVPDNFVGEITLFHPGEREESVKTIHEMCGPFVVVDFTHPSAVNGNVEFYCRHDLPFVMGTTGGDRLALARTVEGSKIPAVIAPNMATQVVALQAAIGYMAETFPSAFSGFELKVTESHQQGKADTSGTAKALIDYFRQLGVPYDVGDVEMIRDPAQQLAMGIKEEHLSGHGYHTYRLNLPGGTMQFEFVHNIGGRLPYVMGTMKALSFLVKQVEAGVQGKVFSMIDVLKAG